MSDNVIKKVFTKMGLLKKNVTKDNNMQEEHRINGKVKWFDNRKGYGFIEPNIESKEDVFAHFRQISGEGYKTLREGETVEFTMVKGENGLQADNIIRLNPE